jgi:trans-aconitate methyltransferase
MLQRYKNTQIEAYLKPRELKEHEKEMLELIKADFPVLRGKILDIGCAAGDFINELDKIYPQAQITGLDINENLIELARKKIARENINFVVSDALTYAPPHRLDVIVASGILSVFDDFIPPLGKWLSWLNRKGKLYIFGCFNSRNIDTIVRFRNHYTKSDWESGLTSYAISTVGEYLNNRGYSYKFKKFLLNVEIPENENPIRTFTVRCADGSLMIVNGANIVNELFFLIVTKKTVSS